MWFGLAAWPRLASFVDSNHPELVPLAFAKTRDPGLQLINNGAAVAVVGDQSVKPPSKLVLLLNDVVSDWPPAVRLRLLPSKRNRLVVEVRDVGFLWRTWWF